MQDEHNMRSLVTNRLARYFSQLQSPQRHELAVLAKLNAQLDEAHSPLLEEARLTLLNLHVAEHYDFHQMQRNIQWLIEADELSSDDRNETVPSDAIVQ